jgi:hypothetical protein
MYTHNKPNHLSPYDHPDIYPGPAPKQSFVYFQQQAIPLSGNITPSFMTVHCEDKTLSLEAFLAEQGVAPISERYPVLSYGSNVCLAHLQKKFSNQPNTSDILIHLKGQLMDSDVIYAACITTYGAMPAMLAPMRGASCQVWLTLMDAKQLKLISATEGQYTLKYHKQGKLLLDCGMRPKEFYAYNYPFAFTLDGEFYRFPDIPAMETKAKNIWEGEMLARISGYFGMEREKFITQIRTNKKYRNYVQKILDLLSLPIDHPEFKSIQKLKKWKQIINP